MLLLHSMKHRILIALAVCVALFSASCMWSPESSFFSSFSTRQLVERNKSSAGLTCDPIDGGGGGVGSRAGGICSGGRHFCSPKNASFSFLIKIHASFYVPKCVTALSHCMDNI